MRKLAIAALLSCAISTAWGQAQPTPPIPTPQAPRPDPGQFWRNATVALGQLVQIGGQSRFVVSGTGVIVALDNRRGCILTARHMLVDPATGMLTRFLWMRVSTEHGEEQEPVQLTLFDQFGRNVWVGLPDNDLAVIPIPFGGFVGKPLSAVSVKEFVSDPEDVWQGAQVLVLGYPQVFRNPDQTNPYSTLPIARSGIVAWTDPADPLGKPFLVDANLYGGNSGGPVFRVRNGFDKYGNFKVGGAGLEFIGIVSRGPETPAPVIAGNGIVTHPNPQTGIPDNEYALVPYVGGIGVVEPASKALALLEQVFAQVPANPTGVAPQAPQ
jgi:hypothetical protein